MTLQTKTLDNFKS